MGNAKKVAVGAGIAVIWVGGFLFCWKSGELIGRATSKGCLKATQKLLTFI